MIARQGGEQQKWWAAVHDRVDVVLDVIRQRLGGRGDPSAAIFIAWHVANGSAHATKCKA
jgi:hypothetical protein